MYNYFWLLLVWAFLWLYDWPFESEGSRGEINIVTTTLHVFHVFHLGISDLDAFGNVLPGK